MKGHSYHNKTSGLSERHSYPMTLGVFALASIAHGLKGMDIREKGYTLSFQMSVQMHGTQATDF